MSVKRQAQVQTLKQRSYSNGKSSRRTKKQFDSVSSVGTVGNDLFLTARQGGPRLVFVRRLGSKTSSSSS